MDEHFNHTADDDDDEQLARHLTDHNQHLDHDRPRPSTPPFARSDRAPSNNKLDPSNASHSNAKGRSAPATARPSLHNGLHIFPESAQNPIFPSTPSDVGSAVSPRFSATPQKQNKHLLPATYTPSDRSLPSREVTNDNLDDAYVEFILYCNPVVSPTTDSTELRRNLRAPPKSDGKTFSTYTLLELIRRFESKEIKTWTSLAIQLGVEPPVMEKNQSAQKVQQYAVRLKRWMHAMHVDAFFEYCLGKPHSYYTHLPPLHAPYPEHGRDGVPLEEDLALRALHPESRPKRGRRKTEEKYGELEERMSPAKRPHLDTSAAAMGGEAALPGSAVPSTGHTDDIDRYVDHLDPWTAASAVTPGAMTLSASSLQPSSAHPPSGSAGGQQFRWRLNTRDANSPLTPHPHSAVTPNSSHPPDSGFDEPQSAITPSSSGSKARSRRRHGPAVSSAWPSSGNPLTGKLRGRPPSNRSVRDGPFSTFPANPHAREGPVIDLQGSTPVSTPITEHDPSPSFRQDLHDGVPQSQGKPTSLQLRVPQHTGGVVRLASPTILLNGASGLSSLATNDVAKSSSSVVNDTAAVEHMMNQQSEQQTSRHQSSGVKYDNLLRQLSASFLNAEVPEGDPTMNVERAKQLAIHTIDQLQADQDDENKRESLFSKCAAWFGFGPESGVGPATKAQIKSLRIRPAPVHSRANGSNNGTHQPSDQGENNKSTSEIEADAETYIVSWILHQGPLTGDLSLRVPVPRQTTTQQGVSAKVGEGARVDDEAPLDEDAWKKKVLALRKEFQDEISRIRRGVLEAVL